MNRRKFMTATAAFAAAELLPAAYGSYSSRALGAQTSGGGAVSTEVKLADFALGVKYSEIPRDALDKTKTLLIDTIACAYGGVNSAPAKIAEKVARHLFGGHKNASILASEQLTSTEAAAFVNGVLVRYLDLNDIYVGRDPLHPSEIIPVALAACEEKGRSGREFIEALVVGYEGELRINDAVSFLARGYHPLSAGAFISPLVAGKAWGMSRDQLANAIGISGARGLTTFVVNSGTISMMKALGHPYSAVDGLIAARLAAEGFTGPSGTLEWVAAKLQPAQSEFALDLDPKHYRLRFVGLKRFPVQFELQAPVEAGVKLHRAIKSKLQNVESITVKIHPQSISRVADPAKYHPKTKETADHSLPICLAIALLDGGLTNMAFEEGRWRANDVIALAQQIKVEAGAELVAVRPNGQGASVEVRFGDGETVRETVEVPEGHAERPMSRQSLENKFREFAVPVIGQAGARRVLSMIDGLEDLRDVRTLTAALRGSPA